MAGKERQLSNKVYRNGLWIWTEVTKSKDKECTQLFWNKFNVSDFSSWFFLPDLSRAYDMVRVIEGKIAYKTELKGNKNYFEIAGGSSYRRFELPTVKLQQMKSRGNRLWFELTRGWSYRGFELSGVNCMFKNNVHFHHTLCTDFWTRIFFLN